jgi:hypothetical protein
VVYRSQPDPYLIVPGEGLRGILVGRATAEDVLAEFGTDAKVSRYDSGEIFAISYDYRDDDEYAPDRVSQEGRPAGMRFEFGLLHAIEVGVYQTNLRTSGGAAIGAPKDRVIEVFGPDHDVVDAGEGRVTLRYRAIGIELTIDESRAEVVGFVIFRARR